MGLFKEREQKAPDIVPNTEEISALTIEKKEVVTPTTTVFMAQVNDDKGQPMIVTPENKEITIEMPANQVTLQTNAKGSGDDQITWFSAFWLRILKKAMNFGWNVSRKATT
jgi:hypothetical protein